MKKIIYLILISFFLINCQPNSVKKSEILKYEIREKKDISYIGKTRAIYRIMLKVDKMPTENEMKHTATYIWANDNTIWNEFTVFIYLPNMNTQLSAFGTAEFNKNGLVDFKLDKNALLGTKWELKEDSVVKDEIPVSELKEYKINLTTKNEGNRNVKINISTDFPDGVKLLLDVSRTHYIKGKNEAYSGNIFSKDLIVKNGKIETIVNINDAKWYNEYQELVKSLPDDFKPISKISDKIEISVLFSPMRDQTDKVLNILGKNGEFVGGDGVDKLGNIITYRVEKELQIPFKK